MPIKKLPPPSEKISETKREKKNPHALYSTVRAIPIPARKLDFDPPDSPLDGDLAPLGLHDAQALLERDARHAPLAVSAGQPQIAHMCVEVKRPDLHLRRLRVRGLRREHVPQR